MATEPNCVFCRIAAGALPAVKVYEDERTLAFMDLFPAAPGHTLVIAKNHHADLLGIDDADLCATALSVRRLARAIKRALEADGVRVSQFNGVAAGQTVFHYHVHVVPMREGQMVSRHGRDKADPAELEAVAARIRMTLLKGDG